MIVFTVLYLVAAAFCGVIALVVRRHLATQVGLSKNARLFLKGVMIVVLVAAIFAVDQSLLTLLPGRGVR